MHVKWSRHYEYEVRPLRSEARRDDWVETVLKSARRRRYVDPSGRVSYRRTGYIRSQKKRLRVVTNEADDTIITVHFIR